MAHQDVKHGHICSRTAWCESVTCGLKFFNKSAELCQQGFRLEIHRSGAFNGDPVTCKETGYLYLSTMREISVNNIAFGTIIDKGATLPGNDGSFK